jgi:hypothetical protein
LFASKTQSWKKAATAIAKREASKTIISIIFMLSYQYLFNMDLNNPPIKLEKQFI